MVGILRFSRIYHFGLHDLPSFGTSEGRFQFGGGAKLTEHEVWEIERSKKKHSQNNVLVMQITEEYFTFSGDMFYIEL